MTRGNPPYPGRRRGWLVRVLSVTLALAACTAPPELAAPAPPPVPAGEQARVLVAVRETIEPAAPPAERPALPPAAPLPASTLPAHGAPAVPQASSIELPILMYHRIQHVPPGSGDSILLDLSVPPAAFRQHLALLREMGARAVGLDDVVDFLFGRRAPPDRAVVLTFDDGYEDTYTEAFPAMRALGMRGTVFVVSDFVGQPGYVTWEQLRELAEHGWSVESHSVSHPDLRHLPDPELRRQLGESKAHIEREVGRAVRYLNYPAGQYDRRVIAAAAVAGYTAALTTRHGTQLALRQLFELPRVRIHGADDAELLRARLPWQ